MILYYEPKDLWITCKNVDKHSMPSGDLTGDDKRCECDKCEVAYIAKLGRNWDLLP